MPVESRRSGCRRCPMRERWLRFAGTPPVLDLAHLGLGPDGHTASLVPGDPVLEVTDRDVAATGAYQGHRRMTLTYPHDQSLAAPSCGWSPAKSKTARVAAIAGGRPSHSGRSSIATDTPRCSPIALPMVQRTAPTPTESTWSCPSVNSSLPAVYLARHGETEWSISGQHTGLTDLPLTQRGEANARNLGRLIGHLTVRRSVGQPARSARRRTCELAGYGQHAKIDDDLVEWNYGEYEGKTTRRDPRNAARLAAISRWLPRRRVAGRRRRARRPRDRSLARRRSQRAAVFQRPLHPRAWPPVGSGSNRRPAATSCSPPPRSVASATNTS